MIDNAFPDFGETETGRRAASLPRFFVARNRYLNPVTRKGLPPKKRCDTIAEKSLTTYREEAT